MKNTLVIIPTYNEVNNVSRIISSVFSQPLNIDILIVDDNSPDGTSSLIKKNFFCWKEKKSRSWGCLCSWILMGN